MLDGQTRTPGCHPRKRDCFVATLTSHPFHKVLSSLLQVWIAHTVLSGLKIPVELPKKPLATLYVFLLLLMPVLPNIDVEMVGISAEGELGKLLTRNCNGHPA
eukprot:scaffold48679_cov17-Tisochrysis_lutea.AAC.4